MADAPIISIGNTAMRGNGEPSAKIIAIGGGKGGVGKSFVSSSLAIFLANMGHRTLAIDLDLGGSNLHTSLGEAPPKVSLSNYFDDPNSDLQAIAVKTNIPNLRLISGSQDHTDIPQLGIENRSRLMSEIFRTPADFIILDLSAGTQDATLDFFLMAQRKLVVLTPEPTSIENAYRFMKAVFFRKIKRFEALYNVQDLITSIMSDPSRSHVRSPADLLNAVAASGGENGQALRTMMRQTVFDLVLNQVRTRKDIETAEAVGTVARRYFGTNTSFLGHLEYDNAVWQSLRRRKHLLIDCPHSRVYSQILGLARELAYPSYKKAAG